MAAQLDSVSFVGETASGNTDIDRFGHTTTTAFVEYQSGIKPT